MEKVGWQEIQFFFTFSLVSGISLILIIVTMSIYFSQTPIKNHKALFSSNNYPTTLKTTGSSEKLLYSYPVVSFPNNQPKGYFTVELSGALVPSVSFSVRDQNNKVITSKPVVVSQITTVYFTGSASTTEINLFVSVTGSGLQLKTLTIVFET